MVFPPLKLPWSFSTVVYQNASRPQTTPPLKVQKQVMGKLEVGGSRRQEFITASHGKVLRVFYSKDAVDELLE